MKEFPFKKNYFPLSNNSKMHYVDEGVGDPMLLVHGNPTWSFYYRNIIKAFKDSFRAIAIDHLGHGLSDKPQTYDYCLKNHIENLSSFVKAKKLKDITLVVHDWGGPIGLSFATQFPHLVKRIIILNTAAFNAPWIPKRICALKTPFIGPFIIKNMNGFALPATFMAVKTPLSSEVKKGFLFPYQNAQDRVGINAFVQDIPLSPAHKTYQVLEDLEKNLSRLKNIPTLFCWGKNDFCFTLKFLDKFKELCPIATYKVYDGGHYVIEDNLQSIIKDFKEFFREHR